jgi:hypothetical protein
MPTQVPCVSESRDGAEVDEVQPLDIPGGVDPAQAIVNFAKAGKYRTSAPCRDMPRPG